MGIYCETKKKFKLLEVTKLVLEQVQELVLEVQMASSNTSVLELVLELVQELQMASSRTSVLELVL